MCMRKDINYVVHWQVGPCPDHYGKCDFETDDLCGYLPDETVNDTFVRMQGPSGKDTTGPWLLHRPLHDHWWACNNAAKLGLFRLQTVKHPSPSAPATNGNQRNSSWRAFVYMHGPVGNFLRYQVVFSKRVSELPCDLRTQALVYCLIPWSRFQNLLICFFSVLPCFLSYLTNKFL